MRSVWGQQSLKPNGEDSSVKHQMMFFPYGAHKSLLELMKLISTVEIKQKAGIISTDPFTLNYQVEGPRMCDVNLQMR